MDMSAETASQDRYAHLPIVPQPAILQAPYDIPPLHPASRSTVYLLLGPESPRNPITSITLRATSVAGPLELNIPVQHSRHTGTTIHALAARKAIQDLDEGRGWLEKATLQTRTRSDGASVRTKCASRFDELVEREIVQLGEKFQVASEYTSFVAVEQSSVEEEDAPASFSKAESSTLHPNKKQKMTASAPDAHQLSRSLGMARRLIGGQAPRMQLVSRAAGQSAPILQAQQQQQMQQQQQQMQQQQMQQMQQQPMYQRMQRHQPQQDVPMSIETSHSYSGSGRGGPMMQQQAQQSAFPSGMQPGGVLTGSLFGSTDDAYSCDSIVPQSHGSVTTSHRLSVAFASYDALQLEDVPEFISHDDGLTPAAYEPTSLDESYATNALREVPESWRAYYECEMEEAYAGGDNVDDMFEDDEGEDDEDNEDEDQGMMAHSRRSPRISEGPLSYASSTMVPMSATPATPQHDLAPQRDRLLSLHDIISAQEFSGAWKWDASLLRGLGLEADSIKVQDFGADQNVAATALVLGWLQVKQGAKKDVWEMVAAKARASLAASAPVKDGMMVEDLIEKAATYF